MIQGHDSCAAPVIVSAPLKPTARSWNRTKSRLPSSRSKSAPPRCGGIFDYDAKRERLEEVNRELENPAVWSDPERAQNLGRERAELEAVVATLNRVEKSLDEAGELHELAREEAGRGHARRRRRSSRERHEGARGARVPPHVRGQDGLAQRVPRRPGRLRRHRGAGLGRDAAAHVSEVGRAARFRRRRARGVGRRGRGHQERDDPRARRVRVRLAAHGDRRAPARAQVAVRFRQPAAHVVRRRVRVAGDRRRHRDRAQSGGSCASTCFARAAPAASTSTRPSRRSASRTFRPASSCSARTSARSTRTARRR